MLGQVQTMGKMEPCHISSTGFRVQFVQDLKGFILPGHYFIFWFLEDLKDVVYLVSREVHIQNYFPFYEEVCRVTFSRFERDGSRPLTIHGELDP